MDSNTPQTNRNIDIIFCIDATGSMSPCLDMVKKNAQQFHQDLTQQLTMECNTIVDSLNIKVIAFRDYKDDGDQAMVQSEWFDMTAGDAGRYDTFLKGIVADGGGDLPENGLEALYFAITSDWNAKGQKDRQIIVLFTDADALELQDPDRVKSPAYPKNMVDEGGLISLWSGIMAPYMSQGDLKLKAKCKRLIMYAPAGSKYEKLSTTLDCSQFIPTDMQAGLGDLDFKDVIKVLAASVGG